MSSQPKLRVVIAAFNCDSTDVGEPFCTFNWVSNLAERHQVTLLTIRRHNRPSMAPQLPTVEVVDWDDLPVFHRFERFNSVAKPGYVGFYLHVRAWLRSAMRQGRQFDLGHQIGPTAVRYHPVFTGFPIPFVFGPVGGSVEAPPEFASEMKVSSWYTRLRRWDRWRIRHDRFLKARPPAGASDRGGGALHGAIAQRPAAATVRSAERNRHVRVAGRESPRPAVTRPAKAAICRPRDPFQRRA